MPILGRSFPAQPAFSGLARFFHPPAVFDVSAAAEVTAATGDAFDATVAIGVADTGAAAIGVAFDATVPVNVTAAAEVAVAIGIAI